MNTSITKNGKIKALDLKFLKNKESSVLSYEYEKSLQDIETIDRLNEVLSGKKKVEFIETNEITCNL